MSFANLLPWWALGLVLAATAATAWFAYAGFAAAPRRRHALVALRFVTLLLLVLFLMRPVRTTAARTRASIEPASSTPETTVDNQKTARQPSSAVK